MTAPAKAEAARPGDVVEILGHYVGDAPRTGEILEVIESGGRVHYRVRWEDDHESVYYPGSDAVVRRGKRRTGS